MLFFLPFHGYMASYLVFKIWGLHGYIEAGFFEDGLFQLLAGGRGLC